MLVWSFRHYSNSRNKISDFEYLGFSSFWGVIVLTGYAWFTKDNPEKFKILISNPFLAGVFLSFFGFLAGLITGNIASFFRPR